VSQDESERELIAQAIAGDRTALSQLLLDHYDALRHHLTRFISPELASLLRPEDVLQQVFVRAAQSVSGFEYRHAGSFRCWLETIANNLVRDAEKRRRRERRAGNDAAGKPAGIGDSSVVQLMDRLAADVTTPGGRAQSREHVRRLQVAIAGLPPEQREVIERFYLQDQSYEQIAAAMNRSKDAVRGLCYRARQNLRDLMGRSSLYFSS